MVYTVRYGVLLLLLLLLVGFALGGVSSYHSIAKQSKDDAKDPNPDKATSWCHPRQWLISFRSCRRRGGKDNVSSTQW